MKLDNKPLEEEKELDLLLEEIPNATSPPNHQQHHLHHPPFMSPYYVHPFMTYPSSSSLSLSSYPSSSSSSSSVNDDINAFDLLARLQALNLNSNPYPLLYHHPLRRCSQPQNPYRVPDPNPIRPVAAKRSDVISSMKFDSLLEIPGYIYYCARDQTGCRLLQKRFEEGRPADVDRIFNGVIGHVADLMTNPFGNYLVQKLLDVCSEEQRMRVVVRLTQDPSEIIRVSLNAHG